MPSAGASGSAGTGVGSTLGGADLTGAAFFCAAFGEGAGAGSLGVTIVGLAFGDIYGAFATFSFLTCFIISRSYSLTCLSYLFSTQVSLSCVSLSL